MCHRSRMRGPASVTQVGVRRTGADLATCGQIRTQIAFGREAAQFAGAARAARRAQRSEGATRPDQAERIAVGPNVRLHVGHQNAWCSSVPHGAWTSVAVVVAVAEPAVAPPQQGDEHRRQLDAHRRQPVLVAQRALLVRHLRQHAGVDEALEALGQHGAAHAEVGAQLVEAAHAAEHVAQHEHRPLVADEAGDGGDRLVVSSRGTAVDATNASEFAIRTHSRYGAPDGRHRPARRPPLDDLLPIAAGDAGRARRITYSPKVFIPLTTLCRDRCGYCTFAESPARAAAPYLEPGGRAARSPGPAPAPAATRRCSRSASAPSCATPSPATGCATTATTSTVDYLVAMCRLVLDETGLLPHANAGALTADELAALRPVSASQGMMLETLNGDLDCHRHAPDKTPGAPAGHARGRRRAGDPVHHRDPRRHRRVAARTASTRCGRSPPATAATATCRRSSSRTSCPSR